MKETTVCVAAAPPLAEQQQALEKKDEGEEEEEMGELGKDVVVKEVKESPPPPEPEDNACFKSPAQKVDQLPPGRRRNNGEVARQKDASTPPPPNTPPRKTSKSTPKKTATDEGDEFLEEEIIDGFAIVSFRSAEDLAKWVKEQDDIRRAKEEAERPPKPPKVKKPRAHRPTKERPPSSPQVPKATDASAMKAAVDATSPPAVAQAAALKRPLSVNGDDTGVVAAKVPKVESVDENKNGVIMAKLEPLSAERGAGATLESVKPLATSSSSNVETSHPVDPGHPPASLFVQTSASTSTGVHPTSALGQQAILFGAGGPGGAGQAAAAAQAGGLLAADPLRQALLASNPAAFAAAFSGLPTSVAGNYPFLSPPGFPPSFPGLLPPPFLHGQSSLGVPTSSAAAAVAAAAAVHGTQLPAASGLVRPAGSQSLAQTADPPAAASVKKRGRWCAAHVKIAWDISKNRFPTPKPGAPVASSSSFISPTPSTSAVVDAAAAKAAAAAAAARISGVPDKQRPPSSSAMRATPSRSSSAATPATAPSSATSMHNGAAADAAATLNAMAAAAAACGLPTSFAGQSMPQTSQPAYFPSSSNPFLAGMGAAALFGGAGPPLVPGSSQASRLFEPPGSLAPPTVSFANLASGHLPPHLLSAVGGLPGLSSTPAGQMPFPAVAGIDTLRMQLEQQQMLDRLGIGGGIGGMGAASAAAAAAAAFDRDFLLRQQQQHQQQQQQQHHQQQQQQQQAFLNAQLRPPHLQLDPSQLNLMLELQRQQMMGGGRLPTAQLGLPTFPTGATPAGVMPPPPHSLFQGGGMAGGQLGQLMGAGFPGFMGGGGGGKTPLPFSNTLEQLARHKRDGPADLVNSTNR